MDRRLARWVDAGLISAAQAEQIEAFEAQQRRPLFVYAVAGLGGLAIAIGLVSVVAANWDAIPGRVKIGVDLALVAAVGFGVIRWDARGPGFAREAALLSLYGLVLASIALVGQVYQLGGEVHEALLVWSALTAVVMTRVRSTFAAVVWVAGLQITWATAAVAWADGSPDTGALYISTLYWAPLLCLLVGRSPAVMRARPHLAAVSSAFGWAEVMLCATIGTFAFYEDTASEAWGPMFIGAAVSTALTVAAVRQLPAGAARGMRAGLLVTCLLLAHLPWPLSVGDLDLVAALSFIGLWLAAAFAAHRGRQASLLNAATAIVGIRIIAVYFEVFGSLLDTGLGLILGGLLTLGLVWVWARKRRDFEKELAAGGQP